MIDLEAIRRRLTAAAFSPNGYREDVAALVAVVERLQADVTLKACLEYDFLAARLKRIGEILTPEEIDRLYFDANAKKEQEADELKTLIHWEAK